MALRTLANVWVRIMHALWVGRTPYAAAPFLLPNRRMPAKSPNPGASRGDQEAPPAVGGPGAPGVCGHPERASRGTGGAAGPTTWTPVVGCADETSEHGRLCGLSVGRSSRRQPLTTGGPGGAGLPLGGPACPEVLPAGLWLPHAGVDDRGSLILQSHLIVPW